MNLSIIDTHAHLDMSAFDKDRKEVIARALDEGINTIITVGTNLNSSKKSIELAEEFPEVFAAVGLHPHDVATVERADIASLDIIANHPRVIAIGEIGLDFHRNYSPRGAQLQALKWQLDLATKLELPVIIHCRQAEKDMLSLIREWTSRYRGPYGQCQGVIHCFSGDSDTAKQYLDMGFYLSFGAYIGYPTSRNSHDVIRNIPEDRLLVETDCPFLPPQSHRGKRNEPAYLTLTVQVLAEIREESPSGVAEKTTQNARRLFRLAENESGNQI
ncbi:TatD family hydrolase [Chloroflexota bacterium]